MVRSLPAVLEVVGQSSFGNADSRGWSSFKWHPKMKVLNSKGTNEQVTVSFKSWLGRTLRRLHRPSLGKAPPRESIDQ